ncbi:DUF1365 domain-containing protein [Pedobacter rhizosphaerae]|uniref:DUF1365 domain-containing protein n=1 Tax=Pedobacter rhizosphaerae TaxID=390241 RepID=A0A1H9PVL6_9SPHI|nr:DUF1365 domain-containing protein [Pedobacter rhizosphaerae]SER51653.1 hypothetical protein SAMN04488023_110105 [Pedobacter rhizosphaerae]
MELASSIFVAKVIHHRLAPKKHSFWYNVYMFYIDLDEIDLLTKKLRWFSRNKFNLFSFRDAEHLQLPKENPDQAKNTRTHLEDYLKENGIDGRGLKIKLLTNLNVLGYNFNPVSFYFCFDAQDQPVCCVAEISNTYREMKLFFFGKDELEGDSFEKITTKFFYVSPFIDHDDAFHFKLKVPTDVLDIKIDDIDKQGNRFFISILNGKKKTLTNANMLKYFFAIPLIPLQVMGMIHWQAFKLWLKKIPFHPKAKNPELQRNVYRPYKP